MTLDTGSRSAEETVRAQLDALYRGEPAAWAAADDIDVAAQGRLPDGFSAALFPAELRQAAPPVGRLQDTHVQVVSDSAWCFGLEGAAPGPASGATTGTLAIHHFARLGDRWVLTARFVFAPASVEPPLAVRQPAPGAARECARAAATVACYLSDFQWGDWRAGAALWAPVSWAVECTVGLDLGEDGRGTQTDGSERPAPRGHAPAPTVPSVLCTIGFPAIDSRHRLQQWGAPDAGWEATPLAAWLVGSFAWVLVSEPALAHGSASGAGSASSASSALQLFQLALLPDGYWRITACLHLSLPFEVWAQPDADGTVPRRGITTPSGVPPARTAARRRVDARPRRRSRSGGLQRALGILRRVMGMGATGTSMPGRALPLLQIPSVERALARWPAVQFGLAACALLLLFLAQRGLDQPKPYYPPQPEVWWYVIGASALVALAGADRSMPRSRRRPTAVSGEQPGRRARRVAIGWVTGGTQPAGAAWPAGLRPWLDLLRLAGIQHGILLIASLPLAWFGWRAARYPVPGTPFGPALVSWFASVALVLVAFVPAGASSDARHAASRARAWWAQVRHGWHDAWRSAAARDVAALLGLTALAAAFRLPALDRLPLTFNGDESQMALYAREVLRGTLPNPFSSAWMGHPTLYYFMLALPMRLFGPEVFAARLVPACFGIITVPLTYLLGTSLWGRKVGLAAALLLASSFWHVFFSRNTINNIADPAFLVASVLVLWHALFGTLTRARLLAFAVTGTLAGFSQFFYTSSRIIPLILLAMTVYAMLWSGDPRAWLRWLALNWWPVVVMVACGLVAELPLLAHFLSVPGAFSSRIGQTTILKPGWLQDSAAFFHQTPRQVLEIQFWTTAEAFLRPTRTLGQYNAGRALLMAPGSIFFVVGLLAVLCRPWRPAAAVVSLLFLASFLGGGLLSDTTPHAARLIQLTPVVALLMAVGLERVWTVSARSLGREWPGLVLAAVIVALTVAGDARFFFVDMPPRRDNDAVSAMPSDLGRYVHAMGAESRQYKLYVLGAPLFYMKSHLSLPFLSDDLPGVDVPETQVQPSFVDPSAGAIFAIPYYREQQRDLIRRWFPTGVETVDQGPMPDGSIGPLMTIYRVPREDVAAAQAGRS